MTHKECGATPRSLPLNVIPQELEIIIVRGQIEILVPREAVK